MKRLKIILILPYLILAACANLNDKFDCPEPHGGSCKRMDEVYEMVNGKNPPQRRLITVKPEISKNTLPLWVAPYKDTDGNYHEAKRIYLNTMNNVG